MTPSLMPSLKYGNQTRWANLTTRIFLGLLAATQINTKAKNFFSILLNRVQIVSMMLLISVW